MTISSSRVGVWLLALLLAPLPSALAQDTPAAAPAGSRLDFERYRKEIEPIFVKQRQGLVKCVTCHAGKVGTRLRLEPMDPGWTVRRSSWCAPG